MLLSIGFITQAADLLHMPSVVLDLISLGILAMSLASKWIAEVDVTYFIFFNFSLD